MKAIAMSSLAMMAIAGGINASPPNVPVADNPIASPNTVASVAPSYYQNGPRQYGGGGTGRREILSDATRTSSVA